MRSISVSEIKVYLRCREEHRLAYVLGYRLRVADIKLRFGTVVHAGLAAWWSTLSLVAALAELRREAQTEALDPYETVRAEVMLIGYDARWSDDHRAIETLMVERPFQMQRRGYALGGKIDAGAELGGRRVVVEHKTTSEDVSPGSDYFAKLVIDTQVSLYAVAAPALGLEPDACMYDVLRKPSSEPRLATPEDKRKYVKATGLLYANQRDHDETPDEYRARLVEEIIAEPDAYFVRVETVRLEHELRAAVAQFDAIAAEIVDAYEAEGPALRTVEACRRFGRMCEYFRACTGGDIESDNRFVQIGRRS